MRFQQREDADRRLSVSGRRGFVGLWRGVAARSGSKRSGSVMSVPEPRQASSANEPRFSKRTLRTARAISTFTRRNGPAPKWRTGQTRDGTSVPASAEDGGMPLELTDALMLNNALVECRAPPLFQRRATVGRRPPTRLLFHLPTAVIGVPVFAFDDRQRRLHRGSRRCARSRRAGWCGWRQSHGWHRS